MRIPLFWKSFTKISETPSEEMRRMMRQIGGKASAGERDPQLISKARRRMNSTLPNDSAISERRARGYWNGEYQIIPSEHADAARDLVSVLPIEEAIDAIEEQIDAHKQYLSALLESRDTLARHYRGGADAGAVAHPLRRASDFEGAGADRPARGSSRLGLNTPINA